MREYSLTVSSYDMNVLERRFGFDTSVNLPYFRGSYNLEVEIDQDSVTVEYEGLLGTKSVEKRVESEAEMEELDDWFSALEIKPSLSFTVL